MTRTNILIIVLALSCVTAACTEDTNYSDGSDRMEEGQQVDTGLDDNKRLSELTEAELDSFCDGAFAYAESVITGDDLARFECTLTAQFVTEDEASCNMVVEECLESAEPQPLFDEEEDEGSCMPVEGAAECEATVAELEACMTDQLDVLAQFFQSLSCSADSPDLFADADGGTQEVQIESCEHIEAICPGLLAPSEQDGGEL